MSHIWDNQGDLIPRSPYRVTLLYRHIRELERLSHCRRQAIVGGHPLHGWNTSPAFNVQLIFKWNIINASSHVSPAVAGRTGGGNI